MSPLFSKGVSMEKEVLFTEDAEPPGLGAEEPLSSSVLRQRHVFSGCDKASPHLIPSRWAPRFAISQKSKLFKRKFFPHASFSEWCDWRWQLAHRLTNSHELDRILRLSQDERTAMDGHGRALPVAVTPYYASLLDPDDPRHPLRRTVVPSCEELRRSPGEADDPLAEDKHTVIPGIVHRYPDRVLFLVTDFCSTYCRYCTRSRLVGSTKGLQPKLENWERAISYIESQNSIRDVLLSGGDALTLSEEALEWLLKRLRRIPHVEFLRIGTKVPVVLPQRITPHLVRVLKRFHPLWLSIHFTHPEEITEESSQACERLADAGIPLGSQTVLLKGVNDDVSVMKKLFQGLLRIRVKPYYLYQCDPIVGSSHFRTPVSKGLEIISGLRGHTTGYAVPTYVIDAPGGGGKVPLLPDYVVGREGDDLILKNYQGKIFRYPDPLPRAETATPPIETNQEPQ